MTVLAWSGWALAGFGGATAFAIWRWRARRRDERLARACHELRGPLSVIRLGLQLGSRGGGLSPQRLRAMELELGRAGQALDDLAGVRAVPEWVEIGSLLGDSVEAWRTAAPDRDLSLELDSPAEMFVWGERRRLTQAISNLIANAVEHGDGAIEVHALHAGGMVRIEVTDGGRGLPVPVAELTRPRTVADWGVNLFARPRARARGARGHGLAIVAEVVAGHGGRLLSAPSQRGARIVVELPLAELPSRRAATPRR